MLLAIDNFEQFRVFFDVVYDVTDLIELQLFQERMVCSILDKSHSRFMSVEFRKDFFSLYEIDDVESVTLFAEDMYKIIKSARKIDNVILETNENYLICKFESNNGNARVFEFVLPAEYIQSPSPPSLSLPSTFMVSLNDLKQGIKDLKVVGTSEIQFNVQSDLLSLTAGTEVSTNYVYNIIVDVDVDEHISAKYTLEYIEQLMKFEKINKKVKLSIGNDYPLLYSFEDDIMGVNATGMIAPRIEVE
ncbi:MAG: hypothetical protein J6Y78_04580 [Paludibacteraceae bacterium]|nr:hypothetical protein [Paludibacteraceae bacterium]